MAADGEGLSGECWLCTYCSDEIAQNISTLITENIHAMSVEIIAAQAAQLIDTEVCRKYGSQAAVAGHTSRHVERHITKHMLHANVSLAVMLHGLLDLNEQLRRQVYSVDEETGQRVVDTAQLRNYLALANQITSVYKLGDGNKLLFARGARPAAETAP